MVYAALLAHAWQTSAAQPSLSCSCHLASSVQALVLPPRSPSTPHLECSEHTIPWSTPVRSSQPASIVISFSLPPAFVPPALQRWLFSRLACLCSVPPALRRCTGCPQPPFPPAAASFANCPRSSQPAVHPCHLLAMHTATCDQCASSASLSMKEAIKSRKAWVGLERSGAEHLIVVARAGAVQRGELQGRARDCHGDGVCPGCSLLSSPSTS